MKFQGGVEYLLLIGGIVVVSLVVGTVLTHTTQSISKNLSSYNALEVNYPAYTDSPPTILDFSVSPSSPSTNDSITLYCSASDDVILSSIKIYLDGSLAGECSYPNLSSYSCSSTLSPLPPGTYTAECIATDSNNQSSSSSLTFTVTVTPSNNPPFIEITSPQDGEIIYDNLPPGGIVVISWNASDPDGDPLTFSVDCNNDGTPEATGMTSTSYTCFYSFDGNYTVKVTASDGTDLSWDEVSFILLSDLIPPSISFVADPSIITVGSSTTLICRAVDNDGLSAIHIFDGENTTPVKTCSVSGTSASCSVTVTYYSVGTYTPKCVATDITGNDSLETTTVNVISSSGGTQDNTPPSVIMSVNPSLGTTATVFEINCSASDDNAIQSIHIFVDENNVETCTATTTCTFSSTFPVGTHTATCTAYDYAGNSDSNSVTFVVSSEDSNIECSQIYRYINRLTGCNQSGTCSGYYDNTGNGYVRELCNGPKGCEYVTIANDTKYAVLGVEKEYNGTDWKCTRMAYIGDDYNIYEYVWNDYPKISKFGFQPTEVEVNNSVYIECTAFDYYPAVWRGWAYGGGAFLKVEVYKDQDDLSPLRTCNVWVGYIQGDGITGTVTCGATTEYTDSGTYYPKCVAKDSFGLQTSKTISIYVTAPGGGDSNNCTDECSRPVLGCCGDKVCQYPCTDVDNDGCTEIDYDNGQEMENCANYTGWYPTSSGYEYRDYYCSNGQCTYNVTGTCTNACTAGDVKYRCSGSIIQKSTCGDYDTDPCTEWSDWIDQENCDNRDGCNGYRYEDWTCQENSDGTANCVMVSSSCSKDCGAECVTNSDCGFGELCQNCICSGSGGGGPTPTWIPPLWAPT